MPAGRFVGCSCSSSGWGCPGLSDQFVAGRHGNDDRAAECWTGSSSITSGPTPLTGLVSGSIAMTWLEKRSPTVRWMLVIPAAVGTALLGNLAPSLLDFSGHAVAGDFGGLVAFVVAPLSSAYLGGYLFVTAPAQVAPRGRTAVAAVMLGLVVVGAAIGIISVSAGHNRSIYPSWWWIASSVLTLVAGVFGVVEIASKKIARRAPTRSAELAYSQFGTLPESDEDDHDDVEIEWPADSIQAPDRWGELQAKSMDLRDGSRVEPGDLLRYKETGVGRYVGTQTNKSIEHAVIEYADRGQLRVPVDEGTWGLSKVSNSSPIDKLQKERPLPDETHPID